MNKEKILQLCDDIENALSDAWNNDEIEYELAGHIVSFAKKIAAEITAPPKSNGDRNCRGCKYSDWDADGCTCMIDGRSVYNASAYTCDQYRPAKPLTNADRIRQMTDEELAELIVSYAKHVSDVCQFYNVTKVSRIISWLRKETKSNEKF